jgi:hypothetical protein
MHRGTAFATVRLLLAVSGMTQGLGCGVVGLEANPFLLEPVPDGTLVYQGSFTTLSGDTPVTGIAQIYRAADGDTIRLSSLSAPTDVGPMSLLGSAQVSGNSQEYNTTLRSARGNQNYETGMGPATWSTISIRTAANPNAAPYGTATLLPISAQSP